MPPGNRRCAGAGGATREQAVLPTSAGFAARERACWHRIHQHIAAAAVVAAVDIAADTGASAGWRILEEGTAVVEDSPAVVVVVGRKTAGTSGSDLPCSWGLFRCSWWQYRDSSSNWDIRWNFSSNEGE